MAGFAAMEFAAALLDRTAPTPAGMAGNDIAGRFGIYRSNVLTGLARSLEGRFPVVRRLVGDTFFAALAEAFVVRHPPSSPVLLAYGVAMPDFLAGFAPVAALPYLADVAALELARGHAFHAADAPALSPAAFARLRAADLPGIRFTLHPSVSVVRSVHPVVSIWVVNAQGDGDMANMVWQAEDAVVFRADLELMTERLDPGEAVFLACLGAHGTLGDALAAAVADDADFDAGKALARLIGQGLARSLFPSLTILEDMA